MKFELLSNDEHIQKIGFGTWRIGGGSFPDRTQDERALSALRSAIKLGYTHFDTAEMYGGGHSEVLLGRAIRESKVKRESLFITSKVMPAHLRFDDVLRACDGSLGRLDVDYLDLYLVHWPNDSIPLEPTLRALNQLVASGKVKHMGVSNFDLALLKKAQSLAETPIATDQVPYSLYDRTYAQNGVLEYCQANNILLTAYSPVKEGQLKIDPVLQAVATAHKATPYQVALAWLVQQSKVIAIPMSFDPGHQAENFAAADIDLTDAEMQELIDWDSPALADPLTTLTDINLDDLVSSFGWQNQPFFANLLRRAFYRPAQKFARQILDCDRVVGESGLPKGAQHALYDYARDVKIFGHEHMPVAGPVLFLSNHPGIANTLSLFAGIGRADLRIIAFDRPFLRSLPNISRHLFYIDGDAAQRMGAVKKVAAHLRSGGAVLTFPAGEIEPDPDVYPGAIESLERWTDLAAVFVRFAPETKIVPVLVRRVLWEKAVKHPLTWFKKDREERERLGVALQLLAGFVFDAHPITIRVQFARPVTVAEVGSSEASALHLAVLERMRGLIQNPPDDGEGASVL